MSSEETAREPNRKSRPGAMTVAMQAVHGQRTGPKLLRIGVLQGGRIVEDRTFGPGETVTVGRSEKNRFVVQGDGVPARLELFRRVGNDYVLNATDTLSGRIAWSGGAADLDQMRQSGAARQIPLDDTARGKLVIGSTALLFQFVPAPGVPVRPRLPASVRAGFVRGIDWLFTAFVVFTFATMFGVIVYLENADWPLGAALDAIPEQVAVPIFDERMPPPEATVTDQPPNETEPEGPPETPAEPSRSAPEQRDPRPDRHVETRPPAENAAQIAEHAAHTAQTLIVGALGSAMERAVVDVLAHGAVPGSASDVLSLATGVGPAAVADRLRERNVAGPGSGRRDLGALAARGGQRTTEVQGEGGDVVEQDVRGRIKLEPGEDIAGSGEFDASIVVQKIKTLIGEIRTCYERELKHDPTLAGKLTIEFTIEERGTVSGVNIASNTTGSPQVGTCVSTVFQRLRFNPGPVGGSVTFSYPFVFAPQN